MTVRNILLVDDNMDDNFLHAYVIRNVDSTINVEIALTGEQALEYMEMAQKGKKPYPDLIFLDINMPGMNGFEFLTEAKKGNLIDSEKAIVIIMLTSSLNPSDKERAESMSTQIQQFQNKPLTEEMLEAILAD